MTDPNGYLVLTEQPCGRCGGTGRHLTPLVAVLAEILPGLLRAEKPPREDA